MEDIILMYLKPELSVLVVVLYLIGLALKKMDFIKDKFIPLILGAFGVLGAFLYLLGVCGWNINLLWVSFIQGCLAAGGSVYFNQIYRQLTKKE